MKTGEAGIDRRGLWVDDRHTGTKIRLGEVSANLAMTFAEAGQPRLVREALAKPHFGFYFSKTFGGNP